MSEGSTGSFSMPTRQDSLLKFSRGDSVTDSLFDAEQTSKQLHRADTSENSLEQTYQKFVMNLFGMLYVLSQDSRSSKSMVYFLAIVEGIQLCYFPFSPSIDFPWNSILADWFGTLTQVFNFGFSVESSNDSSGFWAVFIITVITIALCFLNALYATNHYTQNKSKLSWTMKMLRFTSRLSTTVFYIPFSSILLSVFSCETTDAGITHHAIDHSMQCWTGMHLALSIFTIPFFILFLIYSSIITLMYIDRSPDSPNPFSKPSGRVDFSVMIIKATVDFVFVVLGNTGSTWFLTIVCLLTGTTLLYLHLYLLPYYSAWTNKVFVVSSGAYFWAGFSLLIGMILGNPLSSAPSWIFLILPSVCYSLWIMVDKKLEEYNSLPFNQISNPDIAEIKLRKLVRRVMRESNLLLNESNLSSSKVLPEKLDMPTNESCSIKDMKFQDKGLKKKDKKKKKAHKKDKVKEEEDDLPADQSLLNAIEEIDRYFPRSSFLQIHIGLCYDIILKNKQQGTVHIRKAEQLNPALDELFSIFFCRKLEEENSDGQQVKLDAMSLVTFEHHFMKANQLMLQVHKVQLEFWDELMKSRPNLNTCYGLSEMIYDYTNDTHNHFHKLLQINASSPTVIKSYASFTIYCLNDIWRGQELLDLSMKLETDQQEASDKLTQKVAQIETGSAMVVGQPIELDNSDDLFKSDKNAIVTLSADVSRIGIIISCNQAFIDVFGFEKHQLVRQNINIVIPEPFASLHDHFLITYVKTGVSKAINKTRFLLALHKSGYLIPILITLKDSLDSSNPTFLGVIQPVASTSEYIIVDDGDFAVTACTKRCCKLLSTTIQEVHRRKLSVLKFMPSFSNPGARSKISGNIVKLAEDSKKVPFKVEISTMNMSVGKSVYIIRLQEEKKEEEEKEEEYDSDIDSGPPSDLAELVSDDENDDRDPRNVLKAAKHFQAFKNRKKDDDQSSSYSSSLSGENSRMQKFHDLMRNSGNAPDPTIDRMRKFSIIFLVIFIIGLIVTSIHFNYMKDLMFYTNDDVYHNTLREGYVASIYTHTTSLNLLEGNQTGFPSISSDVTASLSMDINNLTRVHKQIYFKYPDVSYNKIDNLNSDHIIPITQVTSGSESIVYRGLWSAILDYLSKASTILHINDVNREDATQYIEKNGPYSLTTYSNKATLYTSQSSSVILDTKYTLALTVLIVLGIALSALFGFGHGPAITRLYKTQQIVFEMFLSISKFDLAKIRTHSESIFYTLKAEIENQSDHHLFSEVGSNISRSLSSFDGIKRSNSMISKFYNNAVSLFDKFREKSLKHTNGEWVTRSTTFVTARKWLLSTIFKHTLYLGVAIAYFFVSIHLFYSSVDNQMFMASELRVSGERLVLANRIHYHLREFLLYPVNSQVSLENRNITMQLSGSLLSYEKAILFGNASLGTTGINTRDYSDTKSQRDILYSNPCDYAAEQTLSDEYGNQWKIDCNSFRNGFLTNGLHNIIESYVDAVGRCISSYEETNSTSQSLASDDYALVELLQRKYLPPIIQVSSWELKAEGEVQLSGIENAFDIQAIIAGFVVTFMYWSYRNAVNRLENILKHNRSLPLIIPVEIAGRIRVVKDFFRGQFFKVFK